MNDPTFLDLPDLALRPSNVALCTMLRLQTDLFVNAPGRPPASVAAYEAFATGAIALVSEECAVDVARRLAPCPDAPRPVLAALHALGGGPAREVAAGLPCIVDAAGLARTAAPAICEGLAARADLDEEAIEALLARDIREVDLALAANERLSFARPSLDRLVDRGESHEGLGKALLARPDIAASDKAPLYLLADAQMRETILTALLPAAFLRLRAPRLSAQSGQAIVAAARSRDEPTLLALLSAAAELPPATTSRFLADESGDGLAILITAIGLAPEDAAAVFLSRGPHISHSVDAVFSLVRRVRTTQPALAGAVVDAVAGELRPAPRRADETPALDLSARPRPEPARRPQPGRYAGVWSAKG